MKFPRIFRQKRSDPQSEPFQIHSLADLDGHFPWPDLGMTSSYACSKITNPLAVAVRALRIVEYTVATVAELHPDDRDADGMTLLGLVGALHDLAKHGEWDSVGTLLNALEYLIPSHDRPANLAGLDPYKGEARRAS